MVDFVIFDTPYYLFSAPKPAKIWGMIFLEIRLLIFEQNMKIWEFLSSKSEMVKNGLKKQIKIPLVMHFSAKSIFSSLDNIMIIYFYKIIFPKLFPMEIKSLGTVWLICAYHRSVFSLSPLGLTKKIREGKGRLELVHALLNSQYYDTLCIGPRAREYIKMSLIFVNDQLVSLGGAEGRILLLTHSMTDTDCFDHVRQRGRQGRIGLLKLCYDLVTPLGLPGGFPNWGIFFNLRTFLHPPVSNLNSNLDHNKSMTNLTFVIHAGRIREIKPPLKKDLVLKIRRISQLAFIYIFHALCCEWKGNCKKKLLNCLQLTCSMLQPSCHPNSTFLHMKMFWHSHLTTEAYTEFLHANCRQLKNLFLQWGLLLRQFPQLAKDPNAMEIDANLCFQCLKPIVPGSHVGSFICHNWPILMDQHKLFVFLINSSPTAYTEGGHGTRGKLRWTKLNKGRYFQEFFYAEWIILCFCQRRKNQAFLSSRGSAAEKRHGRRADWFWGLKWASEEDWEDKCYFRGSCRGKPGQLSSQGFWCLRSGNWVVLQGVEIGRDLRVQGCKNSMGVGSEGGSCGRRAESIQHLNNSRKNIQNLFPGCNSKEQLTEYYRKELSINYRHAPEVGTTALLVIPDGRLTEFCDFFTTFLGPLDSWSQGDLLKGRARQTIEEWCQVLKSNCFHSSFLSLSLSSNISLIHI
ncbi:hypothetical protein VP01_944g3 [Puccinia sorghi]|uniref:Uncharacterized protein n=1 Tax=Puccinia sorghi TaxID=27349 RepID=A0A0L6U6K2_9BASI|nr:hypothetical protein VP01_944g3 [Puccinia sorghi]